MNNNIFKFSKLKYNKIVINILIILSFLFLSFLSISLFLNSHSLNIATDMPFHFKRIMELKTTFMHNDFLPDFAFNDYHGSSVMLMYPYLNLYPIVILSFIIKSKINLIYIYFILNTFITFIISYYSCKSYVKNYSTSYVFSIIYSMSNLFLVHNFVNMDFGLVSSYMVLPLIIFGFMNIINGKNSWLELSLGMIFIAYSHILSLILFSIFLIIWLFVNFKYINRFLLAQLFKSIILFLLLTSIVYLPFLHFYINNVGNIDMPPSYQLTRSGIKPFLAGIYGNVNIGNIGFFGLISLFISSFFYKHFNKINKQLYFFSLGIIILVLLFPKKLTSFGILKGLNQFQFTSRLFIIPYILLVFIFSLIITKYVKNYKSRNLLFIFTIFLAILLQIIGQYNFVKDYSYRPVLNIHDNNELLNYSNYKINSSSQLMKLVNNKYYENNNYIPKKATHIAYYVNQDKGFSNNKLISFNYSDYNTLRFNVNEYVDKLLIPIYMYNNEKINVYLNGKKVNYFVDSNGILSIDNIKKDLKQNNELYIKPNTNKFRIVGIIFIIFGILFYLSLVIINILFSKFRINLND